ncbi:MAG: zf-TFIIB domain-containing protein [Nitrospirota bacterium]
MSDLQEKGYNKEEEFFYRQNKELLEKRRKELDAQRKQQETQQRHAHWMKCPKCGADMRELERQGIKVDQCGACGGIYFDRGELELLLEAKEQKGFLGGLKSLFK